METPEKPKLDLDDDPDQEILESAEDDNGDKDRDPDPRPDDPKAIPKDEGDEDAFNKGEGKKS